MKAVDRNLNGGSPVESGRTNETQRASTTTGSAATAQAGGGDQVEFSNTLGSLARAMSTFNANHASKVQALDTQYRSGAYRADSRAISRSMVLASPPALAFSEEALERAVAALRQGRTGIEASRLQTGIRGAGRLLSSASHYYAGWLRVLAAMTGGYFSPGHGARMPGRRRTSLEG